MSTPIDYLLHLADNAVVLGQRNAEWCGHGPILEEDLALANVSLDLIGQARLLYQRVAELKGGDASEDQLAYFRDAHEFRNYTLLELPHHGPLVGYAAADRDYATTIVRNFLYSALMVLVWDGLQNSADAGLAAIAAKSVKEASYHLHHSRDWLVRLGDGTDESHARVQAAVDHLMPYTEEFWTISPAEGAAVAARVAIDVWALLGHCLFYDPVYYLSNPFEMIKVWEGGLASHGAAIGIPLSIYFLTKKQNDKTMLWILDRVVIVVALAAVLIRLGNLFNSEIIGTATDVPWAFIFARVDNVPRHPSQLYEAIFYLISFIILYFVYFKTDKKTKQGFLFGLFLVLIFGFRFFVEFLKVEQSAFEKGMILDMGQILSIPFVLGGLFFMLRKQTENKVSLSKTKK